MAAMHFPCKKPIDGFLCWYLIVPKLCYAGRFRIVRKEGFCQSNFGGPKIELRQKILKISFCFQGLSTIRSGVGYLL